MNNHIYKIPHKKLTCVLEMSGAGVPPFRPYVQNPTRRGWVRQALFVI